jgi:hypothetical protein
MSGYRLDERPRWRRNERKGDWLMLIAMAIVFILVSVFSTTEKAVASAGTVCLMYALVTAMSDYRHETWFWVTITIFATAHIAAILLISFQLPQGPALSYVVPAMFVDGFAMFGVLKLLASKLSVGDGRSS